MIKFTLLFVVLASLVNLAFAEVVNSSERNELLTLTMRNHKPLSDYSRSRQHLMQTIHLQKDDKGYFVYDVYCGTKFRNSIGPTKMPSDREINVEHTWPQSRFGSRSNTKHQKADLHHLYPTDSKANGVRGNHPFTNVNDGRYPTGNCKLSQIGDIPGESQLGFEPPTEHKGNVARAIFYFSVRYNMEIADYEEVVLRMWNYLDPVDEAEMKRNDIIESLQGNRNPFIDDSTLVDRVKDL